MALEVVVTERVTVVKDYDAQDKHRRYMQATLPVEMLHFEHGISNAVLEEPDESFWYQLTEIARHRFNVPSSATVYRCYFSLRNDAFHVVFHHKKFHPVEVGEIAPELELHRRWSLNPAGQGSVC